MRMISTPWYAGGLRSDDPETETLDVYKGLRNFVRGFDITHELTITQRKDHKEQPANRCISNFINEDIPKEFRGPVLVTRRVPMGSEVVPDAEARCTARSMARTEQWKDVRLADLLYAVNLLSSTWVLLRGSMRRGRMMSSLSKRRRAGCRIRVGLGRAPSDGEEERAMQH